MKKWLLGFLCLVLGLMMAPSAKAQSVAANGLGDVLIFPAYYAAGMARSKIVIVNTSDTRSVAAKVVIRRGSDSKETLDFFIYLSPDDYFEGEIYCQNGSCYFTSNDGSWLVGNCQTPSPPYQLDGGEPVGYVEVIEAWSADLGAHPTVQNICQAYDAWPGGQDTTTNSLMGLMEIYWPGEELAYDAVAIADYNNQDKITIRTETTLSASVLESLFTKNALLVPYDASDGIDLVVVNSIARKMTGERTCYKFKWFDTEERTCEWQREDCDTSPCQLTDRKDPCYCLAEVDFINLEPECCYIECDENGENCRCDRTVCEDFAPTGWAKIIFTDPCTDSGCEEDSKVVIPLLVRAKGGQLAIVDPAWAAGIHFHPLCEDPGEDVCSQITDVTTCSTSGCGWASGDVCHSCSLAPNEDACNAFWVGCEWRNGSCQPTCEIPVL